MQPRVDRLVGFHRIDTPRRTTIDNVRDRTMAKREHRVPALEASRGGAQKFRAMFAPLPI
jgi:hypothetical protein